MQAPKLVAHIQGGEMWRSLLGKTVVNRCVLITRCNRNFRYHLTSGPFFPRTNIVIFQDNDNCFRSLYFNPQFFIGVKHFILNEPPNESSLLYHFANVSNKTLSVSKRWNDNETHDSIVQAHKNIQWIKERDYLKIFFVFTLFLGNYQIHIKKKLYARRHLTRTNKPKKKMEEFQKWWKVASKNDKAVPDEIKNLCFVHNLKESGLEEVLRFYASMTTTVRPPVLPVFKDIVDFQTNFKIPIIKELPFVFRPLPAKSEIPSNPSKRIYKPYKPKPSSDEVKWDAQWQITVDSIKQKYGSLKSCPRPEMLTLSPEFWLHASDQQILREVQYRREEVKQGEIAYHQLCGLTAVIDKTKTQTELWEEWTRYENYIKELDAYVLFIKTRLLNYPEEWIDLSHARRLQPLAEKLNVNVNNWDVIRQLFLDYSKLVDENREEWKEYRSNLARMEKWKVHHDILEHGVKLNRLLTLTIDKINDGWYEEDDYDEHGNTITAHDFALCIFFVVCYV